MSHAFNILFFSRHWILYKQYAFYYFLTAFCINYAHPPPSPFSLAGDITESLIKDYGVGLSNVFEGVLLPWSIRQIFIWNQRSFQKFLFGLLFIAMALTANHEMFGNLWVAFWEWNHHSTNCTYSRGWTRMVKTCILLRLEGRNEPTRRHLLVPG